MKSSFFIALLLSYLLSICISSVNASEYSLPLFLFSPQESNTFSFTTQQEQLIQTITSNDLQSFLTSFTQPNALFQTTITPQTQPELLCIFIEAELRTQQLQQQSQNFAPLQQLLNNTRSLFVPHAQTSTTFLTEPITSFIQNTQDNRIVVATPDSNFLSPYLTVRDSIVSVELAGLKKYLNEHKELGSDGKLDLLIVHLNEKESINTRASFVYDVANTVGEITNENYFGMYAADTALDASLVDYLKEKYYVGNGTNPTDKNWFDTYFPGWFWEAFIANLILILILAVGFTCMMEIQTPDKFAVPKGRNKVD